MPIIEQKRWKQHAGSVLDVAKGFHVISCETCGFKHVVPLPTEEELQGLYRHDYYASEKPLYLERHKEDLEWWNLTYGDRYDTLEELLPAGRRRILDVGSGPGYFLLHGKDRGWDVVGVEPSVQAYNHSVSLGLRVINAFLDKPQAENLPTFDAIHMSTVLEHLPDPAGMLRIADSLLDPGGLLCVVVPNDYSPFQRATRALGQDSWWVAPPHHLNYFDFDSLCALFEREGFEVAVRDASFPIDLFLLMGDNYVGDDKLGRACHAKRKAFELNLEKTGFGPLRRRWHRTSAELAIGREAVIYGISSGMHNRDGACDQDSST
ncbi:class I SAM-dependent methyltransferase [Planctomycetota bacterium]